MNTAANVISTIARKELLEQLRDARFWWAGGIILVLMLTALLLGWQQMQLVDKEHAEARAVAYQQWLDQGDKNPHQAAHFGQYAFKPMSPLAFVDPGIDRFVGSTVWMEAHKQNEFNFRPARDATSLQRFGELTMTFVLQTLVPLVIVLLSFSAFTGERESGTLRQLLSIGVKPSQLLAGKSLAIATAIGALLLPMALLGFVALGFAENQHAGMANLYKRGAWLVLGYAIYLTGFIALALGVSAASSSSRKALIMLLAFWVVNGFIAPRAMTDLARLICPTPTKVEFQNGINEARKASFGHDETHPAFVAFRDEVLKQYKVARIEDLPISFRGLSLRKGDENGYRIYDEHYGALWNTYARQERIRAITGFAFPLAALRPFSMGLAGTDTFHQNRFATAAELYRRQLQTAMSEDLIQHHKNGDNNYVSNRELWEKIPALAHQIPEAETAIAEQSLNLGILLMWMLTTIGFAVTAARRLRP
ncbi:MAG: DUF3526 domain-containing protein [Methylobacter sp.]|jgi:ABC-2 type transport system permease protein|uniref:DUF3526 domain-containing protein n=1 Tax=Methylobacter sp. TaxID=2051955 RepID=UPI0025D2AECD|nr:DUF3526 domain-containing protein [Methylobacter sp.]MCK9620741.1 DUF3526 domain-containing protein [Methylobacter sp.]